MMNFSPPVPSPAYLGVGSRFTGYAAAWCGVHCALTPFLVLAAPALTLSEGVERAMWVGTVVLGATLLGLGPARRRAAVVAAFAGGAILWAASLAGWLEPVPEPATSAAGSLLVAGALLVSARICRTGECGVCEEEERTEPPE